MVCWTVFWHQIDNLIPHPALFQDNKFTFTPLSFWCYFLAVMNIHPISEDISTCY